jgi:hypothetical protein
MTLVDDPQNPGWKRGYAVLSPANAEWRFYGLYETRLEAESAAALIGPGLRIEFGSHRSHTDEWIEGMSQKRLD